ncbi:MAG: CDP-alcohol phosphatidyltransferase family protein [Bacteroidales bacterium]|nr:CDP-alcohol phosphatidyltransferase family protein [Bacteroidales bacterium]
MKRQIPNLITLGNLLCGVLAIRYALKAELNYAAFFICFGIFLDFFDGMAARLLKVPSAIGKELDSLADVVTSGVAPAFIVWTILDDGFGISFRAVGADYYCTLLLYLPFVAFLMPLFTAYRLAKFNIDEEQAHGFKGLPAPANALIWIGVALYLQGQYDLLPGRMYLEGCYRHIPDDQLQTVWHDGLGIAIAVVSLVTNIMMVSNIRMFSLKFNFNDMSWKSNRVQYLFLIGCALLIAATSEWYAISLIILWYIVLSAVTQRKHAE